MTNHHLEMTKDQVAKSMMSWIKGKDMVEKEHDSGGVLGWLGQETWK